MKSYREIKKKSKIFYDKLEFIYVEIAKFNKSLDELETLYDKWLYALKNLYKLTQRPKELCDKVFDRLFEEAEIAKFTPQEMREYEASKMAYRDIKNSIDTAKREARHLVDTTTALVPHHCLVGSVEIRRAKDFHPLDNARAEQNKTPNGHNHRLGADNNGVMTHLSISSLSSRHPRCRCRQGVRSIAGSASHPSRYRYPLRGQERRL